MKKPAMHPEFAHRLNQACEGNSLVPSLHYGRLGWFKTELERKYGIEVTNETVRKWFVGETRPKPKAIAALAEMLKQDVAWLSTGVSSVIPQAQAKTRNAMANGATNVVAGLIQMAGFHPAFPTADDTRAKEKHIDLYSVIRGTQYSFHISPVEVIEQRKVYRVPVDCEGLYVIGVSQVSPTVCEFFKLDWESIMESPKRAGSYEVPAGKKLQKIDTFSL